MAMQEEHHGVDFSGVTLPMAVTPGKS